jgi:hypothetical protein
MGKNSNALGYYRNKESLSTPQSSGHLNLTAVAEAARDSRANVLSETDVVNKFGPG